MRTDGVVRLEGRGLRGRKGDVGDVNPQMPILVSEAEAARDAAQEAAGDAAASAALADTSANFAEEFSGPAYASVSAGEAATTAGQFFRVPIPGTDPVEYTRYQRTAGGSVVAAQLATTAALAGDDGASLIGIKQTFAGAVLRSLADWFSDEISVMDFIPLAERVKIRLRTSTWTGTSDAFQAATDAAASRGGALVKVPSGTYPNVEGVVLKPGVTYEGSGQANTIIRMPVTPTAHMFSAATATAFDGGGFSRIQLDGMQTIGTAAYHGIDFEKCDRLEEFSVDLCYIHHFDKGWNGSLGTNGLGNDRFPIIRSSRFQFCNIGAFTNEHGNFSFNDFRQNDIGLAGRINDLHSVYNKFTYNRIGCIGEGTPAAITNSDFTSCVWYGNTEMAGQFDTSVVILGGVCVGSNNPSARGGTGDIGFRFKSSSTSVVGTKFGQANAPSTSFADCAILIERDTIAGQQWSNNTHACIFHLFSPTGVGIRVNMGTQTWRNSIIAGNTVDTNGRPFLVMDSYEFLTVADTNVRLRAPLAAGESIFEWTNTPAPGNGSVFRNNSVLPNETGWTDGHVFKGNLANLTFALNQWRSFPTPLSGPNSTAAKWRDNVGYRTENSGQATIASGTTSVTVAHGLDQSPSLSSIQVTPLSNPGALTWWVSNVTSTSIVINTNTAPGTDLNFSWSARNRGGNF